MAPARTRIAGGLALALIAALFLVVNLIAQVGTGGWRLDLTENRLYTLSDGTQAVLAKLDEPVTLRLYYSVSLSNQFPAIKTFATRVTELLDAFKRAGHGNVRVEIIDPISYTQAEDEASAAGIQGNDTPSGEAFYFGLVGTGPIGGREVIPVITPDRESFLEYDLTRLIVSLTAEHKPVLGVISALPLDVGFGGAMAALRGQSHPFTVYSELSELYDVRMFAPDFVEIGSHIDALLIAHPPKLNDQQLYAIDQFVLSGGRAVVLVDPNAEVASQGAGQGAPPPQMASNLDPLFAKWGVKVADDAVIGDADLATKVTVPGSRRPMDYLVWLRVPHAQMNPKDVVTADLNQVLFATTGAIQTLDGATTKVEPLITTTADSGPLNPLAVRMTGNPDDLRQMFKPGGKPFTLAARITGTVSSAFPDGPPKVADAQAPNPTKPGDTPAYGAKERAPLKQSEKPVNLIVIADADVLDDRLWVQDTGQGGQRSAVPVADNGNLILNAVENLAGSSDLIAVRGRGPASRPFTVIADMKRAAEQKFQARAQELQAKLQATEAKIQELRSQRGGANGAIVSAETEKAIADARAEVGATRRELRDVQRNLDVDIDRLESRLRFVNIGLVPIIVALVALVLSMVRMRARRARRGIN
ncbi:Gldg family protein [Zavarzinia sp.]|uniref:Gldg family protein n=1 Tax=Zavarzinia sp. TaxID=2027920 RepID=UPI003569F563